MILGDIYSRIAVQSGLENVSEFADVIPYCFSDAFVDVIKLPKSDIDRTPFYVDEMLPLVIMDSQSLIKSNNVGEYDLSDIDRLSYLANVESAKDSTVKYKYLEIDAFNDVYRNKDNGSVEDDIGYWTRLGKVIRIMNFDNLDSSMVLIIYVLNPNTDDWTVTYDFINAGYGFGFISAVIEVAINKLIDISKRRV